MTDDTDTTHTDVYAEFNAKLRELHRRGYECFINPATNENYWQRGDVLVTIHTVRGGSLAYFVALLDQKERDAGAAAFDWEVI